MELNEMLERLGSEYVHGYGPTAIPSPIDREVSDLVRLMALDNDQRNLLLSKMSQSHGMVLNAFAERMASQAVRENSSEIIYEAFNALSLAAGLVYIKEALPVVSLLFCSMQKIHMDVRSVFTNRISSPNREFNKFLEDFLQRSEENRSIEVMGYIESHDEDGFRYKRTW